METKIINRLKTKKQLSLNSLTDIFTDEGDLFGFSLGKSRLETYKIKEKLQKKGKLDFDFVQLPAAFTMRDSSKSNEKYLAKGILYTVVQDDKLTEVRIEFEGVSETLHADLYSSIFAKYQISDEINLDSSIHYVKTNGEEKIIKMSYEEANGSNAFTIKISLSDCGKSKRPI